MAKMSGWQKAGLIAGIGCASIVAVLVLGVVVAALWARSTLAEFGDATPVRAERTVSVSERKSSAGGAAAAPASRTPLRLTLELQEADFTIRPGAAGGDVQIEGTWPVEQYELVDDRQTDPDGTRRVRIRFRSKVPGWARLFGGIFGDDDNRRPDVSVTIPRETPLDLTLGVGMGESRIDLGGLALGDLQLDLSMGDHRVTFAEPVADSVRRLRLNASMGNVEVANIGNTRARVVEAHGSMGNLTADLSGPWKPASVTELSFNQSMGELTIRVPPTVRLETSFETSMAEARNQAAGAPQPEDPNAPVLRVNVSTSMGETRVVRY